MVSNRPIRATNTSKKSSFNCALSHLKSRAQQSRDLKQKTTHRIAQNSPSNVCFPHCMYGETISIYAVALRCLHRTNAVQFFHHKVNDDDDSNDIKKSFHLARAVTHFSDDVVGNNARNNFDSKNFLCSMSECRALFASLNMIATWSMTNDKINWNKRRFYRSWPKSRKRSRELA